MGLVVGSMWGAGCALPQDGEVGGGGEPGDISSEAGKADGVVRANQCNAGDGTAMPSWGTTTTPASAASSSCNAANDCRLPKDVNRAFLETQTPLAADAVAAYIALDASPATLEPCLDPSVNPSLNAAAARCLVYSQAYPVALVRAYIATLPARLRTAFVKAAAAGIALIDPLVETMTVWTALKYALGQIFGNNVEVKTAYASWQVKFAKEEAVALKGRWNGGTSSASPATYQAFPEPSTFNEIRNRNQRLFCTYKASQRLAPKLTFKPYEVMFRPFFGDTPILKFEPVLTVEKTGNGQTADACTGLGMTVGGRQGMRVQLFGADVGDLTGPWVMNLAEADVTEGSSPGNMWRRSCDDANRNCRTTNSRDFRKQYRRIMNAQTMTGASATGDIRVKFPVHKTPVSAVYAGINYLANYGRVALPSPDPKAFPAWFSSMDFSPNAKRARTTASLAFRLPAPLYAPVTLFDGAFPVNRNGLFTYAGFAMPEYGRSGTTQGQDQSDFARIAANNDRTVKLGADNTLGIDLSGAINLGWVGVELGGKVGLKAATDLEMREQLLGVESYPPRRDEHVTSVSFIPNATLSGVLGLWADVWLKLDLGLFSIEWKKRVVDWNAPFVQDSLPPASELDRLRLTTWTDAQVVPAIGFLPQAASHLPRPATTTGTDVTTFTTEDASTCLGAPVDTPVPPAPAGQCNSTPPALQVSPCFLTQPVYQPRYICPTLQQTSVATALAQFLSGVLPGASAATAEGTCRMAEAWFGCRGYNYGTTRQIGTAAMPPLLRTLDTRPETAQEFRLLLWTCARARAIGAGFSPDQPVIGPAMSTLYGQIYLDSRMRLCGADGNPLGPQQNPTVGPASSGVCPLIARPIGGIKTWDVWKVY